MNRLLRLCLVAGVMGVSVHAAPASAAGTYDVVSCDAAGGPNHAWHAEGFNSQLFVSRDWCPALGQLGGFGVRSTVMRLTAPQLSSAWWRFDTPPGTSISSVDWAGRQVAGAPGWATRIQTSLGTLSGCGPSAKPCVKEWVRGSSPDHYEANGAAWIRVGTVCLQLTGCPTSIKAGVAATDAATSYSRIRVADGGLPQIAASGGGWSDGWIGAKSDLNVSATDASGISEIRLDIDGHAVSRNRFNCDYTHARPCADRTSTIGLNPAELTDGRHHLVLSAIDAADNRSSVVRDIAVDTHAPLSSAAPKVAQGAGWQATRHFDLSWSIPTEDGGSPVVASVLSVCSGSAENQLCMPAKRIPATVGEITQAAVELPAAGEWSARVAFVDAANPQAVGSESEPVTMRWDPSVPGAGAITVPQGWLTREAARVARASVGLVDGVDPPLSGIEGWSFAFGPVPGTQPEVFGSTVSVPLAGLPEGISQVTARAFSGAGVGSRAVASARVQIDATPPEVELELPQTTQWSKGPALLTATGHDQVGLSGMQNDAGDDTSDPAGVALLVDGQEVAHAEGERVTYEIASDGVHRIAAVGRDAAGNTARSASAVVKIDSTPPERLAFLPQDTADPRIVRVDAGDYGSGLASVAIQIRPIAGGQWTDLPTSLDSQRAEAVIDDSKLASGLWELRSVATDNAGNQTTSDRVVGGDPAVVSLPLRIQTRLTGGLASQPLLALGASAAGAMKVANGAVAFATGLLEDSQGLAVPRGLLRISSRPLMPGGEWTDEGTAMTDRNGRFALRLNPGPSRELHIVFDGNRSVLGAQAQMSLRVASRSSLTVNPKVVRVGKSVMFRGHLDGGWLPSGGKIVMVQAWLKNVGWQTFAAVRANQDGDWATPYRFRATVGRVVYQIRAVVPSESGYPFEGSETTPIKVTAVG